MNLRRRQQPEKIVQQHITTLLRTLGGTVYTLGTHRRRGDYQGTMQSPGIPDLWAFLPPRRSNLTSIGLWVEAKVPGGKRSPEQIAFGDFCLRSGVPYVWGDLDAVYGWLIDHDYLQAENVPHYRRGGARE